MFLCVIKIITTESWSTRSPRQKSQPPPKRRKGQPTPKRRKGRPQTRKGSANPHTEKGQPLGPTPAQERGRPTLTPREGSANPDPKREVPTLTPRRANPWGQPAQERGRPTSTPRRKGQHQTRKGRAENNPKGQPLSSCPPPSFLYLSLVFICSYIFYHGELANPKSKEEGPTPTRRVNPDPKPRHEVPTPTEEKEGQTPTQEKAFPT